MSTFLRWVRRYGTIVPVLLLLLGVVFPTLASVEDGGDQNLGVHTLRANGRTMALAHDAGVRWVVQLVSWREVETWKGRFFWEYPDALVRSAGYYGLNLILRVDQQPSWARPTEINGPPENLNDYADFLFALASRYRGKVKAYVVWNEPNLAVEWGGNPPDPEAYAKMLKLAYSRIKEADPQAIVIAAGLAPTNEQSEQAMDDRLYLRRLYEAHAGDYFDVLGAHPYGFAYAPDDPHGAHEGLNFRRVMDLREIMVENRDERKQVWATEFGWATGANSPKEAWKVVSEAQQAGYLVEAVALARREWPWLGVMSVWNLSAGSSADVDFHWYSLIREDYSPRPSYFALQELGRRVMSRN